jgi:hypothetical protein
MRFLPWGVQRYEGMAPERNQWPQICYSTRVYVSGHTGNQRPYFGVKLQTDNDIVVLTWAYNFQTDNLPWLTLYSAQKNNHDRGRHIPEKGNLLFKTYHPIRSQVHERSIWFYVGKNQGSYKETK